MVRRINIFAMKNFKQTMIFTFIVVATCGFLSVGLLPKFSEN